MSQISHLSESTEIELPATRIDTIKAKIAIEDSLSTFWKQILLNYSGVTLPQKNTETISKSRKLNQIKFNFDASLSQSMYEFSRQYNSNLFCFFYLGLIETLSKLTHQQDIAITTLIYNSKNCSPLNPPASLETSPLLLRYKLNPKLSFCEQFTQASLNVLQAYEHKDSNLEVLLAELNLNSPELFHITMSVTDEQARNMIYLPCKEFIATPFPSHPPKAEISFSLQYTEEGIRGELCYNENRYETKFIEKLLCAFKQNLEENLQYFNK